MPDFDPSKTPGSFGAPPPEAPREVAQPLSGDTLTDHLARAAAHERALPPFNPTPSPVPVETRMGVTPPTTLHAAPRDVASQASHQPAASSTDSPSRGVPRPITDPGKVITGGFGHASEAQYFPLDGTELKELVRAQMDAINARLDNDLRFSIAITYPRARVRVVVEVEAYGSESGFSVEKIGAQEKTPIDVARLHADRLCFVILEQRQEMADDGTAEHPPNRIREELGLEIPRKQQIDTPGGRMMVDVPTKLEQLF